MNPKSRHTNIPGIILALIDIGTSAVRMTVTQTRPSGEIQLLESLQQAIPLGKDTFGTGFIGPESTEACAKAIIRFKTLLQEYGVVPGSQIRAIATSAVREALNREMFLNRIFIATGIRVELLDEEEGNRYTFMSVFPLLDKVDVPDNEDLVIAEVGSGSTEMLIVRNKRVVHSHAHRLGSMRMRETLETLNVSSAKLYTSIKKQISSNMEHLRDDLELSPNARLLILGSDASFAASALTDGWDKINPVQIEVSRMADLSKELVALSIDELVEEYHMHYISAESVGPALIIYIELAKILGTSQVLIAGASLRDGIIAEMAAKTSWNATFEQQIIYSAQELGRKYEFDEQHAQNIAGICRTLFTLLRRVHGVPDQFELALLLAGWLHEVGRFIGERSHHKHSMYIIENSEIFGLSKKDKQIVAMLSRYHRRLAPSINDMEFAALPFDEQMLVLKLSALLRVADALGRTKSTSVDKLKITVERETVTVIYRHLADVTLEQLALNQKGALFHELFGLNIIIRSSM